jgi:hypothetical protein
MIPPQTQSYNTQPRLSSTKVSSAKLTIRISKFKTVRLTSPYLLKRCLNNSNIGLKAIDQKINMKVFAAASLLLATIAMASPTPQQYIDSCPQCNGSPCIVTAIGLETATQCLPGGVAKK